MSIDVVISKNYPTFITDEVPVCSTTDPEAFFPEKGVGGHRSVQIAKKLCRQCPYVDRCLQWALDNSERGIWGGTTEKERRQLSYLRTRKKERVKNKIT
jgi:WhiB family transcriptional regulator, redox-sensing transcriptional regulator